MSHGLTLRRDRPGGADGPSATRAGCSVGVCSSLRERAAGVGAATMVRLMEEGIASLESPPDSARPIAHTLPPDTTCADVALAKANRELRMLIDCKRVLARAQREADLLEEICRVLVGPGGYRLAWVGFADEEPGRSVRVVAQAGHDRGYVQCLQVSWSDGERGRGPTGSAIREGRARVCRSIDSDPDFRPWREKARRDGYRSSVALPLFVAGTCIGALSIYADRADAFDGSEIAFLEELASDL